VANAAEEIQAQQRYPTIETIRALLGTGSHGTIATHLRTWKTKQTDSTFLSAELPETLHATLKGLWAQVSSEANAKIGSIQQQAETEQDELKEELEHFKREHGQLRQAYDQQGFEKESLSHTKLSLEQAVVTLQQDILQLTVKQDGLQSQLQEKDNRIAELLRLNSQTQNNLEHYRESSREQRLIEQQRYEREQQEFQHTRKSLQEYNALLNQEKMKLQQHLYDEKLITQTLKQEIEHIKNNLANVEEEFEETKIRLHTILNVQDKLQEEKNHLIQTQVILEEELIMLRKNKLQMAGSIELLNKEMAEIKLKYEALVVEKWQIVEEKAKLQGRVQQLELLVVDTGHIR
jgi:chromosome segregation ATPase